MAQMPTTPKRKSLIARHLLHEIFVDTLQVSLGNLEDILGREEPIPQRLRSLVEFYVSMMIERRAVMLVWFKERAHRSESMS